MITDEVLKLAIDIPGLKVIRKRGGELVMVPENYSLRSGEEVLGAGERQVVSKLMVSTEQLTESPLKDDEPWGHLRE